MQGIVQDASVMLRAYRSIPGTDSLQLHAYLCRCSFLRHHLLLKVGHGLLEALVSLYVCVSMQHMIAVAAATRQSQSSLGRYAPLHVLFCLPSHAWSQTLMLLHEQAMEHSPPLALMMKPTSACGS